MTRHVLILGAGGLGREVFWWAKEVGMEPLGFIDDNPGALGSRTGYAPILGGVETAPLDCPVLCAIGQNTVRRVCVERLRARGAHFASLIHPQAKVLHSEIGHGSILAPFAYIGADAHVGAFLFMQTGAVLGHDVRAGDFLRLDTTAFVGGYATLGHHVTLHTGAQIMPGKYVGDGCTIGAGAVLLNNLHASATVFGIPAQKV